MQERPSAGQEKEETLRIYGVVQSGKPLTRAIWTESRELAEDMIRNALGDSPAELWEATLLARIP